MSQGMPQELSVRSVMDHEGTVKVGRYNMMKSGNSVGGRVPKEYARVLNLIETGVTDVYVNFELGVVMHEIPDLEGDE